MKIVVAAGAFKHSLSAADAAQAIVAGLRRSGLNAELVALPIADGGNGTLDALLMHGGQRRTVRARDPLGRPIEADFGLLNDQTAVVEMALASGLELLADDERDPLVATTYGTGQLMQAALDAGARRVIVGLGGSATVDGGAGCLQALGVRLRDSEGRDLPPGGGNLARLASVDPSGLDARWQDTEVILATDVENPALGGEGAAAVFGPQKGATPAIVEHLEANLRHFFTRIHEQTGIDVRTTPGGGAAGAFSAGLLAFLKARIEPGIEFILKQVGFDAHLREASLVITSEGRLDEQTIYGKGPIGIARRAAAHGVPVVVLVGGLQGDEARLHEAGLTAVLPIVTHPMPLEEAIGRAADLVERAALRLGYLLDITRGNTWSSSVE